MARGGSGLRTAVKIVKAINKAQKQATRQAEQDRARRQRELLARERELERELKAAERASIAEQSSLLARKRESERKRKTAERVSIAERRSLRKVAKEHEKNLYAIRVQERAELRADFIRSEIN